MRQNLISGSKRERGRGARAYPNPLPRSVSRRSEYRLLDGDWRFELDPDDRGLAEQWYGGHVFSGTARWPGSIESQMADAQETQQAQPWQDRVVAWYERDFEVPEEWRQRPDEPLQLAFGACSYETRVWLNGRLLETVNGEDVHYGGYTSFSYELPAELLQPVSRLTVRIAHSLDEEIPRGKQESRVYRRGGIWYQTISGPVRSVWLEPLEQNRLRSRLDVFSRVTDRVVQFNLTTRVRDAGDYTLRLVITPLNDDGLSVETEYPLALEAGEKRQWLAVALPEARLWSPQEPNLYRLQARLIDPAGRVSQIEANFGLRRVEARGRSVYLNNEPIYLDGILYQPATATYEETRRHMLAMKELGCNLVRVHIAGIDPRIYDLADEMGMLLWVEVPCPHSSSERSRDNHRAELMRLLVIAASHPSIIILSLYNEDWGVQDIDTNPATRQYIADTYNYLRLNLPQVLVVDNDGWRHISVEGQLKTDLLTVHIYTPGIDQWQSRLDRLVAGENKGITAGPLIIGDPFFYRGQLPLVVSEWGGFGFSAYGGPEEGAEKAKRIRAFKREIRQRPIAGDIYTQATSIEQELNGLIEPATGELLVPPGLLASEE